MSKVFTKYCTDKKNYLHLKYQTGGGLDQEIPDIDAKIAKFLNLRDIQSVLTLLKKNETVSGYQIGFNDLHVYTISEANDYYDKYIIMNTYFYKNDIKEKFNEISIKHIKIDTLKELHELKSPLDNTAYELLENSLKNINIGTTQVTEKLLRNAIDKTISDKNIPIPTTYSAMVLNKLSSSFELAKKYISWYTYGNQHIPCNDEKECVYKSVDIKSINKENFDKVSSNSITNLNLLKFTKLQSITFGDEFNETIIRDNIPESVTSLTFGKNFNNGGERLIIKNNLPTELTSLTFGDKFNNNNLPISGGDLPERLTSLTFGKNFNNGRQPMGANVLPENLTSLTFGERFSNGRQPMDDNVLPKKLTSLTFGDDFDDGKLILHPGNPLSNSSNNFLPPEIITLNFVSFDKIMSSTFLPKTLTTLNLGNSFNQPICKKVLPESLTSLTFGNSFNQPIGEKVLQKSLTSLTFGNSFNQPIGEKVLPKSLTSLTFGNSFNQTIGANVLPESLISLNLHKHLREINDLDIIRVWANNNHDSILKRIDKNPKVMVKNLKRQDLKPSVTLFITSNTDYTNIIKTKLDYTILFTSIIYNGTPIVIKDI
jgi:hypothetical protein